MRNRPLFAILPFALVASVTSLAGAQGADSAEHAEHVAHVAYGVTVGGLSAPDRHTEQAVGAILEYHPTAWLEAGLNPSVVRSTDSLGLGARSGLTDVGASLGVSHGFDSFWSPSVGVSGGVSLPTGNVAAGLGSGRTTESMYASAGVSPHDGFAVRAGFWHGLSTDAGTLAGSSLSGEASYDLGPASVNVEYGGEVGGAGIAVPSRQIGGGLSFAMPHAGNMVVNAAHTLRGDGPRWQMNVGFGTAFAGLNAVGATSPVERLTGALGKAIGGLGRGQGRTKSGSGSKKTTP